MAKDRTNVRIFNDLKSAVWVAPKGSVLPTSLAVPDPAFIEAGWLGEDGTTFARDWDKTDYFACQGGTLVRSKIKNVVDTFQFVAIESNRATLGLYYRGAPITVTGTAPNQVGKIAVTAQAVTDERAWIVDEFDGATTQRRFVIPTGEVTEVGDVVYKNDEITAYDLTVSIYGDYDIYTNEASLVAA